MKRLPVPIAVVAMLAAGCGGPPSDQAVLPEYDKTGKLTLLTYDRDGNGVVDTWGYMDGPKVVRVEVDEDGDGKVDRWEFHLDPSEMPRAGAVAAAGRGPDQTVARIERATRHDGRVSRREFFEKGALTRVEEDTDGDGKIDKWETYNDGTLSSLALDNTGRGTPDRRLIYRPDGTVAQIEADLSGSGRFEPVGP